MGNSMAYPVFRSSSATDVYALAQRLRALMSWSRPTVRLAAELQTAEDVWRMLNVLPNAPYEAEGASFDPERWSHEYRADALPTTSGDLEALLPIFADADVPADGVEQSFVRALGTGPATIDWHGVWQDAPELGLLANSTYEGVQAVFNTDDVDWERPAGDHTVFVHMTKFGNFPRAQWLAGQVGASVLGARWSDGERNGQSRQGVRLK
ncbi:hypothetical protein ACFY3M_53620 [Streptomyces mirabilis]|uniref:hypothetical protein n=1 Tax=Streptomyces mirabilis TaxID=68239 RepID=UPI0036BA9F35